MKLKIGIIFGGFSREREISFAGGRTVYDNLNKSLFEAIPVFVDSFGNFILLDWQYVYKGSIRDFYPSSDSIPPSSGQFQVYAESLEIGSASGREKLASSFGKIIPANELKDYFDFAFLCLHGPYGEDGRIQGMLEFLGIPYSGSGIFSSAIGINKAIQKKLMKDAGFDGPGYFCLRRADWNANSSAEILARIKKEIGFPCVVKPANQGSSIGVTIVTEENNSIIEQAIDKAFFRKKIQTAEWSELPAMQRVSFIRTLADIREGLGMPVHISFDAKKETVYHPDALLNRIDELASGEPKELIIDAFDFESEIVIEQFIEGKEFSCIVIRNENGRPVALPPTEIRKGKELFDYRSKYLPGLSRKITPIELPYEQIQKIRQDCERLFSTFEFNVYARIDGFVSRQGKIFLNDPNTTSGMLPSSFFFHQAAEIGLSPSQFLTYIIRTSLVERAISMNGNLRIAEFLKNIDAGIYSLKKNSAKKIRVAVIMGGYSSERHISVESGRNVFEKLSSSAKYYPIPVFLTGSEDNHILIRIPVSLMLKDNADDIREKAMNFKVHEVIKEIMMLCEAVTSKYTEAEDVLQPVRISYSELAEIADVAFIALHGRPGEDGEVQRMLEKTGVPYNGSGVKSSKTTINKYETNEILRKNGFLVANHILVDKSAWVKDKLGVLESIQKYFKFPLIAKPVDDGCSSAVKKIRTVQELENFADVIFRDTEYLTDREVEMLQLRPKEEFPMKQQLLIEELISPGNAKHFLEITGGLLTHMDDQGRCDFEIFEASEALSGGDVLSLEEKFLAGEGQNITPARYSSDLMERQRISEIVKEQFKQAAILLGVEGYARIDAFVRIDDDGKVEVIFIEVNSLPGMTPATCIFHQTAIAGYKPYDFIDHILTYGMQKKQRTEKIH